MRKTFVPSILLVALAVTACASTATMRTEPLDRGVVRYYRADANETVKTVVAVMTSLGFRVEVPEQLTPDAWVVLGEKEASLFSWGEVVRTVVQADAKNGVAVRVMTKRVLATNITAKGDWSRDILDGVARTLGSKATAGSN